MMHILELINGRMQVEELNALLFIGIALFGGTIGGRFFQHIKVPQVVGYILIGLILGESGIRLITLPTLTRFEPINYFALGLISFSLGGELKLDMLKRNGKQFTLILLLEAFGAFLMVALLSFLPLRLVLQTAPAAAVSLLLGSIAAATAAAGTTDVLFEYRTKGIVTSTLLGIIALDDILALFLFTLTASLVSPFLGLSGGNPVLSLLQPLYETVGSIGLGLAAGYILIALLKKYSEEERIFVFSMGAILLVLGSSIFLEVDMLMTAMIMGAVFVNKAPRKSKVVFGLIEKFSTPIYVLLFVFVGAKLRFQSLSAGILLIVAVFIIARFTGKLLGARLGARLSRAPEKLRRYLPFCLLSQSGVAIGLSIIAAQRFPGPVGEIILLVVTTSTFIVQIIGPAVLKTALEKAGETGKNINEESLKELYSLGQLLTGDVDSLRDGTPIQELIRTFAESRFSQLGVTDKENRLIGIVTFDTLKSILAAPEINYFLLAMDIMVPVPLEAGPELNLREAERMMRRSGVDFLCVVDDAHHSLGIIEQRMIDQHARRRYLELQETE
jgi:Kef-type K+ transport system membrane component KefB